MHEAQIHDMPVSAHLDLNEGLAKDISVAVVRALKDTFGVAPVPGQYEISEGMVSLVGDVSGVMGMAQSHLEATLTLCLTFETVRMLLPKVIGHEVTVTNDMAIDAVGEITNMIFGQIKTELNARGHQLKLGIPCVVAGKGHFVSQFHRGKYMIVPFNLEGMLFQVYVALYSGA